MDNISAMYFCLQWYLEAELLPNYKDQYNSVKILHDRFKFCIQNPKVPHSKSAEVASASSNNWDSLDSEYSYDVKPTCLQLISSVDPKFLKLTKLDDKIYSSFRETFKDLDIKLLKPDDLKSDKAKEVSVNMLVHINMLIWFSCVQL